MDIYEENHEKGFKYHLKKPEKYSYGFNRCTADSGKIWIKGKRSKIQSAAAQYFKRSGIRIFIMPRYMNKRRGITENFMIFCPTEAHWDAVCARYPEMIKEQREQAKLIKEKEKAERPKKRWGRQAVYNFRMEHGERRFFESTVRGNEWTIKRLKAWAYEAGRWDNLFVWTNFSKKTAFRTESGIMVYKCHNHEEQTKINAMDSKEKYKFILG